MRTPLLTFTLGLGMLVGWCGAPERAWAAGEMEGPGFRARLPAAFRAAGSTDSDGHGERTYRRRLDEGELVLVATCTECDSLTEAKLEMEVGAALDAVAGLSDLSEGEAQRQATRVEGADDAYEVIVSGAKGSIRTLVARRGLHLVTLTLRAPAGAEPEANEAWDAARGSLTVVDVGSPLGTVLIGTLAALVLLTLGLTLRQRANRRSTGVILPPPRPTATPGADPSEPPVADLPVGAPVMRVGGGSLSRPDDGLPTFTAAAKASGIDAEAALRPPEAAHPKPAPPRPPNLAPQAPRVALPPMSAPVAGPAGTTPASAPRTVPRAEAQRHEPAAPAAAPAAAEAAPAPKRFTITRF